MAGIATIEEAGRISLSAIQDVVDQISAKFQPDKIILFGSHAHGNPTPDSDVDLLVIMPLEKDKKPIRQSIEILRNIDYHFSLDLIVRCPSELQRRIELGDFFLMDAVEKGIVLYECHRPRMAHQG